MTRKFLQRASFMKVSSFLVQIAAKAIRTSLDVIHSGVLISLLSRTGLLFGNPKPLGPCLPAIFRNTWITRAGVTRRCLPIFRYAV